MNRQSVLSSFNDGKNNNNHNNHNNSHKSSKTIISPQKTNIINPLKINPAMLKPKIPIVVANTNATNATDTTTTTTNNTTTQKLSPAQNMDLDLLCNPKKKRPNDKLKPKQKKINADTGGDTSPKDSELIRKKYRKLFMRDCNDDKNDKDIDNVDKVDDNDEIMQMITDRLKLGRDRYGHGVRINEDTTKFGTAKNDWELMALEELLDGIVYITAATIRMRRKRDEINNGFYRPYNTKKHHDDIIINDNTNTFFDAKFVKM